MAQVSIMEFDRSKRMFQRLKTIDVPSIPTKGDKIRLNLDDDIGYVFEVYDTHYGDNNAVDVNVVRISNVTAYLASKFPDIL